MAESEALTGLAFEDELPGHFEMNQYILFTVLVLSRDD